MRRGAATALRRHRHLPRRHLEMMAFLQRPGKARLRVNQDRDHAQPKPKWQAEPEPHADALAIPAAKVMRRQPPCATGVVC